MPITAELLARITVPQTAPTRRRSILLEGEPGTGKTFNVLQMPGPILCIYADNNRMTLEMIQQQRDDITEVRVETWADFDPGLINLIKNRELEFETIVVDSIDMLFAIRVDKERGNQTKLDFDNWANVLNTNRRVTFELTQACRPRENKRDYNLVATIHIQAQTNKDGNLIKYEPSIQGSFRNKIESYFDLVLLADSETKYVQVPNQTQKIRKKTCFIRTISPDNYHTCKAPIHWPARVDILGDIQVLIDNDLIQQTNNNQ